MKEHGNEVIFSQKFPDAHPAAILKKIEEQLQESPSDIMAPTIPFNELLKKFDKESTYEPKPNATKESAVFTALAMEICRNFEIDTEIVQGSHEIVATMDLYCGWHDNAFTSPFAALLGLADDFTLSYVKDDPEYVRISMSYHTHILYSNGEEKEWV